MTKDLKSDKSSAGEKSDKDKSAADGKGKKRALTEEEEANDLLVALREEKVSSLVRIDTYDFTVFLLSENSTVIPHLFKADACINTKCCSKKLATLIFCCSCVSIEK